MQGVEIEKYFLILESLKYEVNFAEAGNNVKINLEILKKYLKTRDLATDTTLQKFGCTICDDDLESWIFCYYLFHVLLTLKNNISLDSTAKQDLISVRHLNDFFNAIKLASRYGVVYNLPEYLQQHPVFQSTDQTRSNTKHLQTSLRILSELLAVKTVSSSRAIDSVVLEIMAGFYSIPSQSNEEILNLLWEHTPKENYFRYLLILKSIKNVPSEIQKNLHRDLLSRLMEPGGFKLLVLNTVPTVTTSGSRDIQNWQRYEVVANIVAHKGHTNLFYTNMIDQIFQFTQNAVFDLMEKSVVPAGVVTLSNMCLLGEKWLREIEKRIEKMYKNFIEPEDVVTGLILMDSNEFKRFLMLQSAYFNGSSFEALPSALLAKYLPILIALHGQIDGYDESKDLTVLISRCLANRKTEELRNFFKSLFNRRDNIFPMRYLHHRIILRRSDGSEKYNFQIAPTDLNSSTDLVSSLIKILTSCNNNILVYNCFVQLLWTLEEVQPIDVNEHEIDLLQSEKEFDKFLAHKFQIRVAVISYLTDLIGFRPMHFQFNENPSDILEFLQNALTKRITADPIPIDPDTNLPILLAIFKEFIENSKDCYKYRAVSNILKTYLKLIENKELKHQIRCIISLIEDGPKSSTLCFSEYSFARSLLSESQSHLRVYGITQLIKLLNDRNEEALSNRHSILAMALHVIRDEESFTYLNCVRLLVCLTNHMQAEVLETLSAEYLNDNEQMEFRLKIGEALIKVTENLGPVSYNFKDVLINCFLRGSHNEIDEFRASSLSNLANTCRLLTYQVHHFFQEMLIMITSTLETDNYLPARRASVLILSQLLLGMENLQGYEEQLLPMYRLLTNVVASDSDEKTRIHATNGLKYLKDKCKSFLFPERKMEKEIKIFGI